MSQDNKKNSTLRQTSILKNKLTVKLLKPQTEHQIKSYRKLPYIKQKKYCSSKNLAVSTTCDISEFPDQFKAGGSKLKKQSLQKNQNKKFQQDIETTEYKNQTVQTKNFFQKRKNGMHSIEIANLKKYSSCNKLASFPTIPYIGPDQYYAQTQTIEPQRQIKSTNSIKLQTIQERPKLGRMPLKKMLKTQLSKTINPRKLQSEHSIQLENEEKNLKEKKKSKLCRDIFDRIDGRTKILVKNPFNRLPKKNSQVAEKFDNLQNFETLQQDFRLSKICEDDCSESEMSMSGKLDIENLIGYMNR